MYSGRYRLLWTWFYFGIYESSEQYSAIYGPVSPEKLHLFSQEGFLAPNKFQLMERDPAEVRKWVELAKRYLELPELLSWAEHIMYIGEKEG